MRLRGGRGSGRVEGVQGLPCILYAPAAPGDAIVEVEVAGGRFAAARGWTVRPVAADTPETVHDAIRRMRLSDSNRRK